ncbi:MAG: NADH-quinone oxidoreductase subunit NuoI [Thermoleophilia bacterium]|nr:NADH-quinone oxidoreductase subunit NuoI [Thermoleophilia bacterium]
MGLIDVIKKGAFVDILRGMSVTGTYFVVDKVTVEYPKEKLEPYPRFRGVHALLTDPETGDVKCVACMLCATMCPSQCINIVGEQTPDGRSRPATFDLDLSRCVFCGFCEEVCPKAAIVMTRHYELATYDKSDFYLTKERLVANQVYAHKEAIPIRSTPTDDSALAGARVPAEQAGSAGAVSGQEGGLL